MADNSPSEAQTLRTIARLISDALPPGWSLQSQKEGNAARGRADDEWSIRSPDGRVATFAIEMKRAALGRRLDELLAQPSAADAQPLVAAPYLSPTIRGYLAERAVSFADATGNMRLVSDRPGLFVELPGAKKDPWPADEALRSLRGRAAGRAVRALVDFRPPFGVRDISERASVPLGSLSRTLDLLEREGLVTRGNRGSVVDLDWERTIRRWAQDYEFGRSNKVSYYLEPRGLTSVTQKLSEGDRRYALTGAIGAQQFTPIAPARQAAVYVDEADLAADRLRLRPADTGANVVLAEPFDPVVFERATVPDRIRVVAASQLAADLLTGPGREPSGALPNLVSRIALTWAAVLRGTSFFRATASSRVWGRRPQTAGARCWFQRLESSPAPGPDPPIQCAPGDSDPVAVRSDVILLG